MTRIAGHGERDARILALRGSMTTEAIAAKLGLTPGVVSGVCYRADHPRPVTPRSHHQRAAKTPAMRFNEPATKIRTSMPVSLRDRLDARARRTGTSISALLRVGAAHVLAQPDGAPLTDCQRPETDR